MKKNGILKLCILIYIFILTSSVTVIAASKVSLNKTTAKMVVGKNIQLRVYKAGKKKIQWKSSNSKIASVNSKGVVKAKKEGKATITANVGGTNLKCTIKVRPKNVLRYNGHSYIRYDSAIDWTTASIICKSAGGHLLTITTAGEQKFVTDTLLKNCKKNLYWIGLALDIYGNWKWVTGNKLKYSNWAYKEPNSDFGGRENVVQIYGRDYDGFYKGEWNDSLITGGTMNFWLKRNTGYICEWDW